MLWRQFLIPTTKETPRDATAVSHQLMLRTGMIRQLAAGIYSYLPLGWRVLQKVAAIIREEMNRAGAIELNMPVLHPIELWEQTGRVAAMGDVLLRLKGADAADWRSQTVLGPTHEEIVTEIAKAYVTSYKQLPVNLYQIQTKFRGEARPKSGVLRTREFLMKDAYSFDADKAGLDASYQKMYDAYCRIFSRCGLPYVAVEADSGAIGGDASHEFMVLTDAGEDTVAIAENGDYAANTERATAEFRSDEATKRGSDEGKGALREVHTPGAGKVEDVCKVLETSPNQMIKTLIYVADAPIDPKSKIPNPKSKMRVVALVRGDHEVNEIKLNKVAGLKLELADPATIEDLTGAKVGFAGPHAMAERADVLIIDRDVTAMRDAASGANKTDYHVVGINPGRDFPLEAAAGAKCAIKVADIRMVVEGDKSPTGSGSPIGLKKAIEVGHVFKLGTKYSNAMGATFLTREGKPQPFIMGCYGIGANRIIAAAIESHHDANGVIWPLSIAPFRVAVIALDPKDEAAMAVAKDIHDRIEAAGIDVILDDRDERAGFKFKDADLIGFPLRVVVGKKSLAEGQVEFSHRAKPEEKQLLAPEAAIAAVLAAVKV